MSSSWLYLFLSTNLRTQQTGKYYIDSTKLSVCENLTINSHKVFKAIAERRKNLNRMDSFDSNFILPQP
ncbi:MAG: transposase [Candidatus Paracaedibacteraceae bacterium]|nr:transposase [Candidatus Paracaedibacteraceae bacterium]